MMIEMKEWFWTDNIRFNRFLKFSVLNHTNCLFIFQNPFFLDAQRLSQTHVYCNPTIIFSLYRIFTNQSTNLIIAVFRQQLHPEYKKSVK